MDYEITWPEFLLAVILAILAAVFNSGFFLVWMDQLNPFYGWLIYEAFFLGIVLLLAKLNLIVRGYHLEGIPQAIGLWLILSAFFICFNWTSPYVQYATTGSLEGESNVFVNNSEDGMAWYFWYNIIGVKDIFLCWILTFPVTVFILTLAGSLFVTKVQV